MSTRAQIHVEGTGIFIYKHSDGYPDDEHGVMAVLEPFVARFLESRGWDPEYMAAQIVRAFARHHFRRQIERLDQGERDYGDFALGWGLGTALHGDEEYVYVVTEEAIEIRVPTWATSGKPTLEATEIRRSVPHPKR